MTSANAYRTKATVGAGYRIEIVAPELRKGDEIEVILLPAAKKPPEGKRSIFDIMLDPDRPVRDAAYWEEREKEMREIRDSWDR